MQALLLVTLHRLLAMLLPTQQPQLALPLLTPLPVLLLPLATPLLPLVMLPRLPATLRRTQRSHRTDRRCLDHRVARAAR